MGANWRAMASELPGASQSREHWLLNFPLLLVLIQHDTFIPTCFRSKLNFVENITICVKKKYICPAYGRHCYYWCVLIVAPIEWNLHFFFTFWHCLVLFGTFFFGNFFSPFLQLCTIFATFGLLGPSQLCGTFWHLLALFCIFFSLFFCTMRDLKNMLGEGI